jgi:hypothetical protein
MAAELFPQRQFRGGLATSQEGILQTNVPVSCLFTDSYEVLRRRLWKNSDGSRASALARSHRSPLN